MYNNDVGVCAFWLPRPAESKKQPMIFVLATQGPTSLEVSSFVACDDDAVIFRLQPEYGNWRPFVRELRVKDLRPAESAEYRSRLLQNFLDSAPVEFLAITGNAPFAPTPELPFVKLKTGWRAEAEKTEADLRERILLHENPAFVWLRGLDSAGPAATCYLQALYLAAKKNLFEKSAAENEANYMHGISDADFFTFGKE